MCATPPIALVLTVQQSKWDPENLHRHPDYATIRKDCLESHLQQPNSAHLKKEPPAELEETKINDVSATGTFQSHVFTTLTLMW